MLTYPTDKKLEKIAAGEMISRTCQYLEGEAKERNFCGEPTVIVNGRRSAYCEEHHWLCWVKSK